MLRKKANIAIICICKYYSLLMQMTFLSLPLHEHFNQLEKVGVVTQEFKINK